MLLLIHVNKGMMYLEMILNGKYVVDFISIFTYSLEERYDLHIEDFRSGILKQTWATTDYFPYQTFSKLCNHLIANCFVYALPALVSAHSRLVPSYLVSFVINVN